MQLQRKKQTFADKGYSIKVLGNGTANFIEGFREKSEFEGDIFTDPSLKVHEALSLKSGLATVLRPSVALKGLKALAGGFRQTGVQGKPDQQGGVFAFDSDGNTLYEYVSKAAGDHPPVEEILARLPDMGN